MATNHPFSLSAYSLESLGPHPAVEFFRQLLWAEAARVGIGKNLISVPTCINVGDGGIDAYIENANPSSEEMIPAGTTGFQIKAADLQPADCKKELHVKNDLNLEIKPEVKRILDGGGNYVLVLFADITPAKKKNREEAITEELALAGYKNKVRVYPIDQIIGFAERFPSIVTWIKRDFSQCSPYSSWGLRRDISRPKTYIPDTEREQRISEVREVLRTPGDNCPVFRVMGLSGIGKTRFVFETLSPDDLKNRVIYIPSADAFRYSTLYHLLQNDQSISAILVVDECDEYQHEDLVRSFASHGCRLALITLSHDFARVPPPSQLIALHPLETEKIKKLIHDEAPGLPRIVVDRLAEFADGYPRIAALLAESYILNRGMSDEYIRISDDGLMGRLMGEREVGREEFQLYKKVYMGISLFRKIGFEPPLDIESKWLADFIRVDWTRFLDAVRYGRRRGILQGSYYLYATPFMLRVYLQNEWWETFGFTKENFDGFTESIPENLRADLINRFFDHIPYVTTTERGKKFAKALLGKEGIFGDGEFLRSELGANFFQKLTEADPVAALECLQRTVGVWSKETLLHFDIGRSQIVWALEKIAIWRELFSGAARILLALGEAENAKWSNNASNTFADLFSPAMDDVAPTEASPEERFDVLQETLASAIKERRELALHACDKALEAMYFSRGVGREKQGIRRSPELWMPRTYQELFDAYQRVWELVTSRLDLLPAEERQKAISILLARSRGLGIIPYLTNTVVDTLRALIAKSYIKDDEVLSLVLTVLRFDDKRIQPEVKQTWEQFKDELTQTDDFSSLLHRYVGMKNLINEMDADGNITNDPLPYIKGLAKQAADNPQLLASELSWLVSPDAGRSYQFGYELAEIDHEYSLLSEIVQAHKEIDDQVNFPLLGGYFNSIFKNDQADWENQLDSLASDKSTASWVPDITWRSGYSDQGAYRVLHLAEKGQVDVNRLQIFAYGKSIANFPEQVFRDWMQFLLASKDVTAASIALNLFFNFYNVDKKVSSLPEELTFQVLTNPSFFQEGNRAISQTMDEYYWTDLSRVFLETYPGKMLDFMDVILDHIGNPGTILGDFYSYPQNILNWIAEQQPQEVWKKVSKYLGPPIDRRAYHVKEWLNGELSSDWGKPGALQFFVLEDVFQWVDEDVEERAWYLASFVPKVLFRDEKKPCFARELLVRFGNREDVRSHLLSNFSAEGWTGPASLHYADKKKMLLDFKKNESDQNVISWIDEYVTQLDYNIEREKMREERRGF